MKDMIYFIIRLSNYFYSKWTFLIVTFGLPFLYTDDIKKIIFYTLFKNIR